MHFIGHRVLFCCLGHTCACVCLIIFLEHIAVSEVIRSKAIHIHRFDKDYQSNTPGSMYEVSHSSIPKKGSLPTILP